MHSQLVTPGGLVLMGADTPAAMELAEGSSVSISLSGDDVTELTGYFEKLSGSGSVIVPLEQAPWGDHFGMCADRYGFVWMVNIGGSPT
jgi:PhnB protein